MKYQIKVNISIPDFIRLAVKCHGLTTAMVLADSKCFEIEDGPRRGEFLNAHEVWELADRYNIELS